MRKFDDMVVGSGISGLTLALLLGMNGRKVLLLEKGTRIGGSLVRFFKQGIPFDTGFHFTGGFYRNGILADMLTVLGIHEYIQPIFLSQERANRFIFEFEQLSYDMPVGIENFSAKLKQYFPNETGAITKYFKMLRDVCRNTVSLDLRKISLSPEALDVDFISLQEILDRLTKNKLLKGLLCAYCACYGVKPKEISFANHSRVSYGLYESVARVKDSGEAFIKAFKDKFKELDIEIECNKFITGCLDIQNDYAGRFQLNTGEEVTCEHCIFTIHPQDVLKVLPQEHLSKAFFDRVKSFEPSVGFFSVFGVLENGGPLEDFYPSLCSLCPDSDMNLLLDPSYEGAQALVIMRNDEIVNNKTHRVVTAFELSFPEHVREWEATFTGKRTAGYQEYKQRHTQSIRNRILKAYPDYKDYFKIIDSASILTFRDYLNTPDGCAYGIKQKIGQYNLFGKLPLRNIYAAGQSSVLPGLVGAMLSSFIVGRSIIGKEEYSHFLEEKLCS